MPEKLYSELRWIDETEDARILRWISRKTGVSLSEVEATTLASYGDGNLSQNPPHRPPSFPAHMYLEWVMPVSYESYVHYYGLQFCPKCLLEDGEPYFRRKWRLAFITHCEKHHVMLLDQCTKCGFPINFVKSASRDEIEILPSFIILCYLCNSDIRRVSSELFSVEPMEIEYQEYLISLTRKDWSETYQGEPFTSSSYFSVLHVLMDILAFDNLGIFLRSTIRQSYGLPPSIIGVPKHKWVEVLRVNERRELLSLAKRIIEDWPGSFNTFETVMKGVLPSYPRR